MKIFLFLCAIIGIGAGFLFSAASKTAFQEIAAGQMILGGFLCLAAASVIEQLQLTRKEAQATNEHHQLTSHALQQVIQKLSTLDNSIDTLQQTAITTLQATETQSAKHLVAADRANQLLEWLGSIQQQSTKQP